MQHIERKERRKRIAKAKAARYQELLLQPHPAQRQPRRRVGLRKACRDLGLTIKQTVYEGLWPKGEIEVRLAGAEAWRASVRPVPAGNKTVVWKNEDGEETSHTYPVFVERSTYDPKAEAARQASGEE